MWEQSDLKFHNKQTITAWKVSITKSYIVYNVLITSLLTSIAF